MPFHLMSFDPAWCLQRFFFYQTAQHQFARASLIFAHDPTWRESSIKRFGLPNGKRHAKDFSFLKPCSKERMPTPRRGTRLLISTHVKLLIIPKYPKEASNNGWTFQSWKSWKPRQHVQVAHPVLPKCQQLLPKWWSLKHLSVRITQNKGKH